MKLGLTNAAGLAFLLVVQGCAVPVAANLDERDANLVADALNHAGIEAAKEIDPASEGRYHVLVARGEAAPAIAALRERDLPPRHAPGVVDSVGKGSLVPSQLAEHAQYVAGLSGDLERSLATVDGVLAARVHLSIPPRTALSDEPPDKPTASVLLKHAGATPPVTDGDVQRLVAGAVSNLAPDRVTVVMVSRPPSTALPDRPTVSIGPITVARASAMWLRAVFAIGLAMVLGLTSIILYLWLRMRRTIAAQAIAGDNG